VDWVIENNVVITDHWHGITLLGAKNSRIVNNTVIDRNTVTPGPPWINIGNHKNGTPPTGCLVRNNLTTDLNLASSGVTEDHNIILKDLTPFFVDVAKFDLHLLPTAPAIDQGSSDQAPATDIEGVPRPQGSAVDVGAHEWHDGSVVIPDGGPGGGAGTAGTAGASSGGSDAGTSGGAGGSAGSGGTASGGTSAGGSAGSTPSSSSGDDSGCGCSVPGSSTPRGELLLLLGIGLLGAHGRRRATG